MQHLKSKALGLKKEGNELYASDSCEEAVAKYKEALDTCPLAFKDDRAVLFSNMAAAKMRLVG